MLIITFLGAFVASVLLRAWGFDLWSLKHIMPVFYILMFGISFKGAVWLWPFK